MTILVMSESIENIVWTLSSKYYLVDRRLLRTVKGIEDNQVDHQKDTNREKHIQVRFTEPEIVKFKEVARDNGLTLSGFVRYSMARTSVILNQVKKEF